MWGLVSVLGGNMGPAPAFALMLWKPPETSAEQTASRGHTPGRHYLVLDCQSGTIGLGRVSLVILVRRFYGVLLM